MQIYTVRKVIDYFCTNNSTVNICTIDISKAFDQINYNKLFCKLMDRDTPIDFICVLKNWYSKSSVCVKWEDQFSEFVRLNSGVKQGGVLSPYLFAVYIDSLLLKLRKSGLGCHIKSFCFNSCAYADNLVLMSISLDQLQKLINLCNVELTNCNLTINTAKSACIRIGPRFKITSCDIVMNDVKIGWEIK